MVRDGVKKGIESMDGKIRWYCAIEQGRKTSSCE